MIEEGKIDLFNQHFASPNEIMNLCSDYEWSLNH